MASVGIDALGQHIRNTHCACLAYHYIPINWRNMKADISFCPISLTSFLLIGLGILVDQFIKNTFIPKCRRHADQKGKSTETAFHEITAKS